MKFVLSSRGSRGDIYPIVEIGVSLKKLGHEVSIAVPEMFEDYCVKLGLNTFLYREDSELVMKELGFGWKSFKNTLEWFSRSFEEQFNFMMEETSGADVLISGLTETAGPTVAQYRKIPYYRIAFAPYLVGYQPPPLTPLQNLPGFINRGIWGAVNGIYGPMNRKPINTTRKKLGLAPVSSFLRYFTDVSHTVLAINSRLAPPCESWKKRYSYSYSGYCYGNIFGDLDAELEKFLQAGPPPVYIGFGSVNVDDPDGFTDMVLESLSRTGYRAIIGSGWTGLGNIDLAENIFCAGETNHGSLFPRLAGIVHHGGSGTTHTAARSGIPQFIVPQLADQHYWGNRIKKMRLGPKSIQSNKLNVRNFTESLVDLMEQRDYTVNAFRLAEEMKQENGVPQIISTIEKHTDNFTVKKVSEKFSCSAYFGSAQ